jgi:hypothetical protein
MSEHLSPEQRVEELFKLARPALDERVREHPSSEQLYDFAAGDLGPEETRVVEGHLNACADCSVVATLLLEEPAVEGARVIEFPLHPLLQSSPAGGALLDAALAADSAASVNQSWECAEEAEFAVLVTLDRQGSLVVNVEKAGSPVVGARVSVEARLGEDPPETLASGSTNEEGLVDLGCPGEWPKDPSSSGVLVMPGRGHYWLVRKRAALEAQSTFAVESWVTVRPMG